MIAAKRLFATGDEEVAVPFANTSFSCNKIADVAAPFVAERVEEPADLCSWLGDSESGDISVLRELAVGGSSGSSSATAACAPISVPGIRVDIPCWPLVSSSKNPGLEGTGSDPAPKSSV